MAKLLIFDIDGTLYNFPNGETFKNSKLCTALMGNIYKFISEKLNVSPTDAIKTYQELENDFNGQASIGIERRFGIDRYFYFEKTWDLNPADFIEKSNLKDLFNSLESRCAFLTNAPRIWAARVLNYLNLAGELFSGEPDLRKPNPEVFRQVCNRFGAKPEETVSIGDQLKSDILPAKSLGMRTILIGSRSPEADYCIDNILELPKLKGELK